MKTMKLVTMLFLTLGVVFTSCEGPEGPEGPIGPAGIDGESGEQGPQGEKGEVGNANIIASDWMDTDFDSDATTYTFFATPIPDLTRAEIDGALVLVYVRQVSGSNSTAFLLPQVSTSRKFDFYLSQNINNGYDIMVYAQSMNGNPYTFDWMTHVRYVIVPAHTSKVATANFKKMSYKEVMDHLGLDY